MTEQRFARAEFAAWIGIVGNIFLALVKGIVGYAAQSKALMADAAHSASDVAGSLAVLIGLKAAKRPPDADHPYGHGKAEPIAAIIVSVLLMLVGLEIGINALQGMFTGVTTAPAWYALLAVVLSIVVKEAMFQYKYRLGKKLASQALIANAWEHRSDVYSSVATLFGIGAAVLGDWWGLEFLYYMDPLAGLMVALMIVRMGFKLIMEAVHTTMDHVLHEDQARELAKAAEQVAGVISVDDLKAREHGHYVIVDIKISVNPRITVAEGHEIGRSVKNELMRRFDFVLDVLTHVNPYNPGYPYSQQLVPDKNNYSRLLH
jgi:cation diffusion facilitator family transporter